MDLRIFLSSPEDVQDERKQVERIVTELNYIFATIVPEKDIKLRLFRWEADAHPAAGRPNDTIKEQLGEYDVFVGIMWKKFGTPTGDYQSGTEEEFERAYRAFTEKKVKELMIYFCQAEFFPGSKQD